MHLINKLFSTLLFLLLPAILFGADPLNYADNTSKTPLMDYFPIIVYGETAGTANVFEFVSRFSQAFMSAELFHIGTLLMGLAIVFGIFRAYVKYSLGQGMKEIIFPVALAALLLTPSTDVYIYDGRTEASSDVRIVSNVPYFVAFTASLASVSTAYIMNIVDDSSASLGDNTNNGFGSLGMGAPEEFVLKAIQKISFDSNLTRNIDLFNRECIIPSSIGSELYDSIQTHKDSSGLYSTFDAFRDLGTNPNVSSIVMSSGLDCGAFANNSFNATVEASVQTKIDAQLDQLTWYDAKNKLGPLAAEFFGATDNPLYDKNTGEDLGNFIGYLKNYKMMGYLVGSIHDAKSEAVGGGSGIDAVNEVVAKASIGNLQVSGLGSWRALGQLIPLAHNYLLLIIYATSVLMGLYALSVGYEKGMVILKEYFIGLLTFEVVKIAFVLVNNIVLSYSQEGAIKMLSGSNPASIVNIAGHLEHVADMAGMAGALGLSAMLLIPGIVFGGKVASAMGILGNAAGMVQNRGVEGASQDRAEGMAYQKNLSEMRNNEQMRKDLTRAGINVDGNADIGAVHADFMRSMDAAAGNLASAAMYKDYNQRYAGVQAQSYSAGQQMIGSGIEANQIGLGNIGAAARATGALSMASAYAQGQAALDSGSLVLNSDGSVNDAYMGGLKAQVKESIASVSTKESAMKQAGALDDNGNLTSGFVKGKEAEQAVSAQKTTAMGYEVQAGGLKPLLYAAETSAISEYKQAKELHDKLTSPDGASVKVKNENAITQAQTDVDAAKKEVDKIKGNITSLGNSLSGKSKNSQAAKTTKQQIEAEKNKLETANTSLKNAKEQLEAAKSEPATKKITREEMLDSEAKKGVSERIGAAMGAKQLLQGNSDIFAQNALASTMTSAMQTQSKINAFGGVMPLVAAESLMATKGAMDFKAQAQAVSSIFGGNENLIKNMQSALESGGGDAAQKIANAMRGYGNLSTQLAHQGLQSQVGQAQSYQEMRNKFGDNFQAKLSETSGKTQAEQGMGAIRGMQNYKGGSQDDAINRLAAQAGRTSYVQAQTTAQDMMMHDKHGGFEKLSLKTGAIQSAGKIAEVKGFESNYGLGMGGVESFLSDSTQQARKKFASVHGSAKAISGWSNKQLSDVADFSEETQIDSASKQIKEGGGTHEAAHKLARKAAAGMRGLVTEQKTKDDLWGNGGYEAIAAIESEQKATDSNMNLLTGINNGLVNLSTVGDGKNQSIKATVSKKGSEAIFQAAADKAAASATQRDLAFDNNAIKAQAKELDTLSTVGKEAMVASGMLENYKDGEGNEHLRMTSGATRAEALAQQKAGNLFGLHGITMADGTSVKMMMGKNMQTGEYSARISNADKSTVEQAGHALKIDATGNAVYQAAKTTENIGQNINELRGQSPAEANQNAVDSTMSGMEIAAVGAGAVAIDTAAGKLMNKVPVKGKDGSFSTTSGKGAMRDKNGDFHEEVGKQQKGKMEQVEDGRYEYKPHPKEYMRQKGGSYKNSLGEKAFKGEDGKLYKSDALHPNQIDSKHMGPGERALRGLKSGLDSVNKLNNSSVNNPSESQGYTNSSSTNYGIDQQNSSSKHNTPPNSNIDNSTTEKTTQGKPKQTFGSALQDGFENTQGGLGKKIAGAAAATAITAASVEAADRFKTSQGASHAKHSQSPSFMDNLSSSLQDVEMATGIGSLASHSGGMIGTAGKMAARVAPGAGLAFGAVDATNREMKGDHLGAAMSVAIAGAAQVPFVGTPLAVAGVAAQAVTDHLGITGTNVSQTQHSAASAHQPNSQAQQANSSTHQSHSNAPQGTSPSSSAQSFDGFKTAMTEAMTTARGFDTPKVAQSTPQANDALHTTQNHAQMQQAWNQERMAYNNETRHSGTYSHIKDAVNSNQPHPFVKLSPVQQMSQSELIQSLNSNASGGQQLTSLDINQSHQTRHLAQQSTDYIKEVSRSMYDLVASMSEMLDTQKAEIEKQSGKFSDKA